MLKYFKYSAPFISLLVGPSCAPLPGGYNLTVCGITFDTETVVEQVARSSGIRELQFGGSELAQLIVPTTDFSTQAVQVKLKKVGAPSGTITLTLQGTGATSPDDFTEATAVLSTSDIEAAAAFYTFTFNAAVQLKADQPYWIRLKASYPASDSNVIHWIANTANGYTPGGGWYLTGTAGSWSQALFNISDEELAASRDFLFKLECS